MAEERMASERAERGGPAEERRVRARELRRLAARLAKSGRSSLRAPGDRARPAPPEPWRDVAPPAAPRRNAQAHNARSFTTPANHIVNDRSTDGPTNGQAEPTIAAFGDLLVAARNDFILAPRDTQ